MIKQTVLDTSSIEFRIDYHLPMQLPNHRSNRVEHHALFLASRGCLKPDVNQAEFRSDPRTKCGTKLRLGEFWLVVFAIFLLSKSRGIKNRVSLFAFGSKSKTKLHPRHQKLDIPPALFFPRRNNDKHPSQSVKLWVRASCSLTRKNKASGIRVFVRGWRLADSLCEGYLDLKKVVV